MSKSAPTKPKPAIAHMKVYFLTSCASHQDFNSGEIKMLKTKIYPNHRQ